MRLPQHGMLRSLWEAMRTPVAPGIRGYLAFGWLLLILFVAQIISGILLSLYYQPSPELASESVEYIMRDVGWGWLIRGIHHWATYGMIWLVLLQLVKVLALGTYRGERASSWFLGLVLMFLVFFFAISGDLLPWDNDAYWAATNLIGEVERLPLLGPTLARILRGGSVEGAATLSRAYSVHVMLLPWLTFFVLTLHLWLMSRRRRDRAEVDR